jgi:hypothetical protein
LGVEEATRALAEFEKGTASASNGERVSAVYALDKYVRKHAIVVERLLKMLRSDKDPALRGAAARVLALTADGGDAALKEKAAAALIGALEDKEPFTGDRALLPQKYSGSSGLKPTERFPSYSECSPNH